MAANLELSEIQHFYKNSTFLLTGTTGFVGKLILEKILRTLHPQRIYVLIRDKDGKSAEERCAEMFDSLAFEPLKRSDADFFKKVTLIRGDLQEPDLGLSVADKQLIINEVKCFFHCAAASKLSESLKNATSVNVRGTIALLNIAKEIKNIKTFVYLSSIYSNFPKFEVHEEFYEPAIAAEDLLKSLENVNEDGAKSMQQQLQGDWPNAYTFTLSVVEDYIKRKSKGLPVTIVRPSLLLPSESEPITGFVDNINGLYGDTVTYALGVNKVNYYNSGILDVIPADYVVNLSIASGWYAGLQKLRLQRGDVSTVDANIYHCITSQEKPITTDDWFEVIHTVTREVPSVKMIQLPIQFNTSSYYVYKFLTFFLHVCMAFLCDLGLKLAGKKQSIMSMYDKIHQTQELFSPYLLKQWYFSNDNTQKLLKRLSFKDRSLFNFDIFNLNWEAYFDSYSKGIRVYLLKDPMSTLTEGKEKQKKKLISQILSASILTIILYVISKFILFRVLLK
ncbi:fatty acyl-CoA reductase 1-like [Diorhabda carinulata]|uniref:fatty acyl-CoA reductase 1-like n=1 Tax=Diorhabda carinulata TaxID=1163345 RepID=UPI00259FF036|nr:fatty acyl-CoA reductase 1-like [Diorhabda carinulata]